jgi:hypothetical protein
MAICCLFSCNSQKADLVVYNGRIYTVDSVFTVAEAMAVSNGRILETAQHHKSGTVTMEQTRLTLKENPSIRFHRRPLPLFLPMAHC